MKKIAAAAALVTVAAIFLWLWTADPAAQNGKPATAALVSNQNSTTAPPAGASATPDLPQSVAATEPSLLEVQSWQGTEVDGDIHLDSAGHVIPDHSLRELFDYLLSAQGQLDLPQIAQKVGVIAQAHKLNAAQTAELQALYASYVDYLTAVADIQVESTDRAGLQRIYDQRHDLRRSRLGVVAADGYFADSEAQDRYVLAKLAITQDSSLTVAQREQRLAAARELAPASVREAEAGSDAIAALNAGAERLRQHGGDAAQLQALRERTVGADAAARLRAVDQEDAAWSQRVKTFDAARKQIESNAGLSEVDRHSQVEALISRDFNAPEAARLRAMLGLAG